MGKRTRNIDSGSGRRIKITVELCPQSADALQSMLDSINHWHGDMGYAAIVRAALISVYADGSWRQMDLVSLSDAKERHELSKIKRPTEPTLDFTKK